MNAQGTSAPILEHRSLERLRTRLERDDNVLFAFIFGSQARGTAGAGSDLDLGVQFRTPPEGLDYLDLLSALSDLAGVEVDLVVLNRASAILRHQAMKHRLPVCIKNRSLYMKFREKTMRDYDTYRYLAREGPHG
jgi:predicted nucleotidyltransferase